MPETMAHQKHGTDSLHGHGLHLLLLGTALLAGAVILSPYALPALGAGSSDLAIEAITAMHATGFGTGLVGTIATGLSKIPFVGETLAAGGIVSGVTSAATGLGGVLLGRFLEKKENGKTGIKWGKVIKYAALAVSALVALPSILSGISVGIVYLSAAFGSVGLASSAVSFLSSTVGAMASNSMASIGLSGAAAALPHLLTCGAALLPALFSFKLAGKHTARQEQAMQHMHTYAATVKPAAQYANASIMASLEVDRPTSVNMPTHAKLRLTDARTGQPIMDEELAVTHTSKLHLYVTDQSLKQYHHIHPHPTDEPGTLAFSFTPQTSNQYNAWADFTLMKDGSNHHIKIEIPSKIKRNVPAAIRAGTEAEQDGLVFHWKTSEPLQKDAPSIVEVNLTDKSGNPVTDLEPVMGAFAHLAGFSADGKHFIHTHPLGQEPAGPDARGGPRLRFHVEPEYSGPMQFYLQIRRDGKEVHVPFGQQIKQPESASERIYKRNHEHTAMHMVGRY